MPNPYYPRKEVGPGPRDEPTTLDPPDAAHLARLRALDPTDRRFGYWDREKSKWYDADDVKALLAAAEGAPKPREPVTHRLFVYGAMRPGCALERALKAADSQCPATYPAHRSRMVCLGTGPGLYHDPNGPEIRGHLFVVSEELMSVADHVMVGQRRVRVRVKRQDDGTFVRAWTHMPDGAPPPDARPVETGDWAAFAEGALSPWRTGMVRDREERKAAAEAADKERRDHKGRFRAGFKSLREGLKDFYSGTNPDPTPDEGAPGKVISLEREARRADSPWRDHLKMLADGNYSVVITATGRRVTWQKKPHPGGLVIALIEPAGQWEPGSPPMVEGRSVYTMNRATPAEPPPVQPDDGFEHHCRHCHAALDHMDGVGWVDVDSVSTECEFSATGHTPLTSSRIIDDGWDHTEFTLGGSD